MLGSHSDSALRAQEGRQLLGSRSLNLLSVPFRVHRTQIDIIVETCQKYNDLPHESLWLGEVILVEDGVENQFASRQK